MMRAWNAGKRKDETTETENLFIMNKLRKKELITWMKQEQELCYVYPSPISIDDKQQIWHTTYSRRKD